MGSIFSLSGYLSLYTKATEAYIATRINTHSVYFTCIKDDKLYTYGYNTNNIQEDTVDHEEDEEYYNKYRSDSIWYGFSEESCNETIQEEISQTKDKLKM